ncbi:MAG TPA: nuclear transport factor 2 family protein [Longimicrobiales bacterium]|nr:nuclear transport factor 2 family protein [Longimicrobiales bacterium]
MKTLPIAIAIAIAMAAKAEAQTAQDSADIRATALNYVNGWYAGDGARMESSLHPELAKRIVTTNAGGQSRLDQMSALSLVSGTRSNGGNTTPPDKQVRDIKILDIFENTASVRADMSGWIDYMHIARANGRWVIVNVLWERRANPRAELANTYGWQDAAITRSDVRMFAMTLAPDYQVVLRNGQRLDRAQVEAAIKADMERTKSVDRATSQIDSLTWSGNDAVVTVTHRTDRTIADEKGTPHRYESGVVHRETWTKTRDGWRIKKLEELQQLYLRRDGK